LQTETRPNRTLDTLGLYCPEPVFRTRVALDKMAFGEVLEVFADDPAAEEDLKSLIRRTGNELLRLEKKGSVILFLIRKLR